MIVYGFMYCDCIHESAYATMSLHTTKLGAYQAMRKFIYNGSQDERNESLMWGYKSNYRYGVHAAWTVEEFKVIEN